MIKKLAVVVIVGLAVFGLIQLIPYGHDHNNPPVVSEPKWSTPEVRTMVKENCFDCHSNETRWFWYSNIAPASWLIQNDVEEGRGALNFSDWENSGLSLELIVKMVDEGKMPPPQYTIMHPKTRLTGEKKQTFIEGLKNSLK